MALQKLKEYDNGFSSEYHKITGLFVDYVRKNVHVDVCSYKDQATRDANKSEIERRGYQLQFPDDIVEMTRELAYTQLKTLPEFDGATDV